jgi:rhodanese-related sulfurtransferase
MSIAGAARIRTISTPEVRHISGSPRSLDKIGREVRSTNLPKNAAIVVYCGGPKCPQSRMAAEKLVKLG